MGNSFGKMCNCSSCQQDESTQDNEEIQSKDPSSKLKPFKAMAKPIIDDSTPPCDISKY